MRQSTPPIVTLFLASILLAACSGGDGSSGSVEPARKSPCRDVPAAEPHPERTKLSKPATALPAGSVWDLELTTNCGNFTIRVDSGLAPRAAASLVSLARGGFYDGLSFHRIAPGFVVQGGDPLGSGLGGPGYTTVDRPDPGQLYPRGTVAMAKSPDQPSGAAGSQFFIVTGEDAQLPPEYAVVGRISEGGGVPDLISEVGVDPEGQPPGAAADGRPARPVVIDSVKVRRVA